MAGNDLRTLIDEYLTTTASRTLIGEAEDGTRADAGYSHYYRQAA
jgi:hypothetical protein